MGNEAGSISYKKKVKPHDVVEYLFMIMVKRSFTNHKNHHHSSSKSLFKDKNKRREPGSGTQSLSHIHGWVLLLA
jgi:hypothetical protein